MTEQAKRLLLIGGGVAAAALMIFLVAWTVRPAPDPAPASSAGPSSSAGTTAPAAPRYYLGVWEDKLALFLPDSQTPDDVYDVYIATLPEEEQQRLRERIPITDEVELARLLEDYTS